LSDFDPPERDRDRANLAGNHVVLQCKGAHIALAHFKKGSVTVQRGNSVQMGQKIGEVGNSGNTSEPHLHIHAQTPSENDSIMGGDPLPMTFGGEYLGPGEVVRVQMN
jgi:6-phosphogluconolactonase (cycloisomerase 2 family)